MSARLKQKSKAVYHVVACAFLAACGVAPPDMPAEMPPLKAHLECLPENAAMISAHRATAYNWNYPENALGGLLKLKGLGYLMAEIDVARSKDGVHYLFHDGVLDELSTGQGPIASATSRQLDNLLLKSRKGRLSDERPARLDKALILARKYDLYLEIDFKSSADYETVIDMIRKYDLTDRVILISYSEGQRRRLNQLAPDMLLSAGPDYAERSDLVWVGKEAGKPLPNKVKKSLIIGRVSRPEYTDNLSLAKKQAHILVTDDADRYQSVTGLTRNSKQDYIACLNAIGKKP